MNVQNKQLIIKAIIKVINSAPTLYPQNNINYTQSSQRNDITLNELNIWVNYANQILDISYQSIPLDIILTTEIEISQVSSQGIGSYLNRVERIKGILLNLAQIIMQY